MNIEPRLIRQAKTHLQPLVWTVLLGGAGAGVVIFQADALSRAISAVFLGGQGRSAILPLAISLLALAFLRGLLAAAQELASYPAAERIKSDLRQALMRRLLELGPGYARGERTGELSATLMEGIESLTAYFSQFLPQLALSVLVPLILVSAVFTRDLWSGLIFLATIPLIPLFMILIGKNAEQGTRAQMNALNRLSAHLLDAFQGLATLKLLGRSEDYTDSVTRAGDQFHRTTLEVLRLTFLSALALELLGTISTAVVAVSIGLRLLAGGIAYQPALFILILAPEIYLPLRTLGLRFHAGAAGVSAARRIFALLDETPRGEAAVPAAPSAALNGFHTIRLEGIGYTYPDAGEPALSGISFSLTAGQKLALVGGSGVGKSTLAGLLLRLYEPSEGRIWVDAAPMDHIPAADWRRQVTWVPQTPHLFYGSLAENLRLARPEASLGELEEAADQAHLLEWVRSLPDGFDTPIGEGGARLSGGQAQRLALARALLKPAPLLILDEPTSHLDPALEASLQDTAARLAGGRSVLTIAHRLATVYRADRILLLDGGRLVAQGTHSELLADNPAYRRLVSAYSGGREAA